MTAGIPRILVVDDEVPIRKFLQISLGAQNFEIIEASNGYEALRITEAHRPDLIVLDLGLPDVDGKDVIAALRALTVVPIIVLSVRSGEEEKVSALDRGANDYVTKPFGIAELMARIRVALRAAGEATGEQAEYAVRGLSLNLARHEVTTEGRPVKLSRKEFDLLALLMKHAGRVLTHKQILREIWGPVHEQDTQYLRVYIGQLRHKLGDDPAEPRFIANEPGVGYRFLD